MDIQKNNKKISYLEIFDMVRHKSKITDRHECEMIDEGLYNGNIIVYCGGEWIKNYIIKLYH